MIRTDAPPGNKASVAAAGEASLLEKSGLPPLAARVLAARGITDPGELLADPSQIGTINGGESSRAATEIATAVSGRIPIGVVCDFDADGICGGALVAKVLGKLQAKCKVFPVDRNRTERGLDAELADKCKQSGAGLVVTVDNGTSSHEGVAQARQLGMRTVITDHHQPGSGGPASADAIANPALSNSGLPAQSICGAMVALLVMRETVRVLGAQVRVSAHLDLAATATVADQMPMDDPFSRQIAMSGLAQIRSGRCQPGIRALLANTLPEHFVFHDYHGLLSRKLNSAGRMGRPDTALACLLAEDIASARRHAGEVESHDRQCRKIVGNIMREASSHIIGTGMHSLVAASRNWQPVGLGLVAEKLATKRAMPCAVLALKDGCWRGSIRGTPEYSVHNALAEIERGNPGMLAQWGGHRNAVGVALRTPPEEFAVAFDQVCSTQREQIGKSSRESSRQHPEHDGEPTAAELCDGSAEKFAHIPWGRNFPEPLFMGSFKVRKCVLSSSGNGYLHTLHKDGTDFFAWHNSVLAGVGRNLTMLFRIGFSKGSQQNRNYLPRLHPLNTLGGKAD